jgi:hypothetical protein
MNSAATMNKNQLKPFLPKSKTKLKTFIILLMNTLTLCIHSQVNFRPGFIITTSRDTIHGKIDYRGDRLMGKVCKFKNNNSEIKKYYPGDICGFRFNDGKCYVTVLINEKPKFLELLIQGRLNIYYLKDNSKPHYFFNRDSNNLTELQYFMRELEINNSNKPKEGEYFIVDEYKIKTDGKKLSNKYNIKSQKHQQLLLDSLKDAPELSEEILKLETPSHSKLIKLAENYHKIISKNRNYIVYHKLQNKFDVEFSAGSAKLNYDRITHDKDYTIYSIKVNKNMPLVSEKLYLGFGVQYAPIKMKYTSYKILRIPLSLRYQYPGRIIKPNASVGLNVYHINDGMVSNIIYEFFPFYNIGIAIKIYKNFHLSCNHSADFRQNTDDVLFKFNRFSQSNSAGLLIDL